MEIGSIATVLGSAASVILVIVSAFWKLGKWIGRSETELKNLNLSVTSYVNKVNDNTTKIHALETTSAKTTIRVSNNEKAIINLNKRMDHYDERLDEVVERG